MLRKPKQVYLTDAPSVPVLVIKGYYLGYFKAEEILDIRPAQHFELERK